MELRRIWFEDSPFGSGWRVMLVIWEYTTKDILFDFSFLKPMEVPKDRLRGSKLEELDKTRMVRLIKERQRLLDVCGTDFDRPFSERVLQELHEEDVKRKITRESLEERKITRETLEE